MMRKIKLMESSGFSLIELMVVVAIIGILAAIGIPQYSKFQAKTRQSEAKSSLTALYTAEQGFLNEFNVYSVTLQNIGFGVSGQKLRYVTGFTAGTGCTGYNSTNGAPPEVTTINDTWSDGTNVNIPGPTAGSWVNGYQPGTTRTLTGVSSSCVATAGSQAFTAMAQGDPNANVGPTPYDGWMIDEGKNLSNPTRGIR